MCPINDLQNLYTNMDAALKRCNDKLAEKKVGTVSTLYEVGDKISTLKADYGDFIDGTITEVEIPNYTVTNIKPYAFYGCEKLTTITGSNSVEHVGEYAFYNCKSLNNYGMLQHMVRTIGDYAYYGCSSLTYAPTDATGIESIGNHAYENCTGLTNILFWHDEESIGDYAFAGCTKLTRVDICTYSTNLTLGEGVFQNCSSLDTFILENRLYTIGTNALEGTPIAQGTGYIYVPSSLISQYQSAENWSQYASQFRAIEDYPEITG